MALENGLCLKEFIEMVKRVDAFVMSGYEKIFTEDKINFLLTFWFGIVRIREM